MADLKISPSEMCVAVRIVTATCAPVARRASYVGAGVRRSAVRESDLISPTISGLLTRAVVRRATPAVTPAKAGCPVRRALSVKIIARRPLWGEPGMERLGRPAKPKADIGGACKGKKAPMARDPFALRFSVRAGYSGAESLAQLPATSLITDIS